MTEKLAAVTSRPVSARLAGAIVEEFNRNGRRQLTAGKLRYLRRLIRRNR